MHGRGHGMHVPWKILRDTVNRQAVGILLECILVNAEHRRFTCRRCPNLNLRQFSESECDASSTHRRFKFP